MTFRIIVGIHGQTMNVIANAKRSRLSASTVKRSARATHTNQPYW
jgi:hypothetical protein